jgi:transcriptional regulator with XRE-family HTH domain
MSLRTEERASGDEAASVRFGENLRLLRARLHISQEVLAFRAEIHRTQISLLESGLRSPMLPTLLKLAGALEVDLGVLLDGTLWRPGPGGTAGAFEISSRPVLDLVAAGPVRGSAR